jgi:hypothetical protein
MIRNAGTTLVEELALLLFYIGFGLALAYILV